MPLSDTLAKEIADLALHEFERATGTTLPADTQASAAYYVREAYDEMSERIGGDADPLEHATVAAMEAAREYAKARLTGADARTSPAFTLALSRWVVRARQAARKNRPASADGAPAAISQYASQRLPPPPGRRLA